MNITVLKKQDAQILTFPACFFTAKNVAADISEKLCDSVATKLEGKVLGTFSGKTTIQATLKNEFLDRHVTDCVTLII